MYTVLRVADSVGCAVCSISDGTSVEGRFNNISTVMHV